jgi:hypothetical protein
MALITHPSVAARLIDNTNAIKSTDLAVNIGLFGLLVRSV